MCVPNVRADTQVCPYPTMLLGAHPSVCPYYVYLLMTGLTQIGPILTKGWLNYREIGPILIAFA